MTTTVPGKGLAARRSVIDGVVRSRSLCAWLALSCAICAVACGDARTVVELHVTHEASTAIDAYDVRVGTTTGHATAAPTIELVLDDDHAGMLTPVEVWGLAGGAQVAFGETRCQPILHERVQVHVDLSALCGVSCTLGTVRCRDDGTETCVAGPAGCPAWSDVTPCPPSEPHCSNGTCAATCTDECADGVVECDGTSGTRTCGQADSDSCRDWITTSCPIGASCVAASCSDGRALGVVLAGTGTGTVTSNPPGITCGVDCGEIFPHGTMITLNATAASGSRFDGWSGGGCSGTGACTVTLSSATQVTATFTHTGCTAAPWVTTVIDATLRPTDVAMVVGADGTLHAAVAHGGSGSERVSYAVKPPGLGWFTGVIAPTERAGDVAIALAAGDAPAIAYRKYTLTDTTSKLAEKTVTGWTYHTLGSTEGQHGIGSAIAIDSAARVHCARSYRTSGGSEAFLHHLRTGTTWTQEALFDETADFPALASHAGTTEIIYAVFPELASDGRLMHRRYTSAGGWTAARRLATGTFNSTSIEIDASGAPHVAFADDFNPYGAFYMWRDPAGDWWTSTISPTARGIDVAVSADGSAHVAYLQDGALKHGWRTGTMWSGDIVDPGPGLTGLDYTRRVAMVVAPDGSLHILYVSGTSLKYATSCP